MRKHLIRSFALLAFVGVLALPFNRPIAESYNIGGADGSFEAGIVGVITGGNVVSATHLGTNVATHGTKGALLSTEPDSGATAASATVSTVRFPDIMIPAGTTTLRLDYAFATDEPTPSLTNDTFKAKLILVSAGGEQTLLAVDTFSQFYDAKWTTYKKHTGIRNLVANVSAHAGSGQTVAIELRIEDVGDGRRNSAVFVDAIRFAGADDPLAIANFDYKEVNVGQLVRFDASASTFSTASATYHWDFGNGYISNNAIVDFPYPDGGIYTGTLTVTDTNGKSSTDTFTVFVGGIVNRPPEIVSTPVNIAKEGGRYTYQVQVNEPEAPYGDFVTYSLDVKPAGMSIDPVRGLISWVPTPSSPLVNTVTVRATDSLGLFDTQTYQLTVDVKTFVIATGDDGRIWYARSNGDGSWSNFRWIAWAPDANVIRGAAIGDFDNDGFLDFIIPAYPNTPSTTTDFYLYKNDGNDNFTNVGVVATTGANFGWSAGMTVGDFNQDGNLDFIATYGDTTNRYSIAYGDGHGGFTITHVDSGIGSGRAMASGDFNDDGKPDFLRAVYNTAQGRLHLNDGTNHWPVAGTIVANRNDPYGLVAGDFNEDGKLDFIMDDDGSGDPYLYAGNGDGTFAAPVYIPTADNNNYTAIGAYDFNRDGHLDLVTASYSSQIMRFYPGNGNGTFGAPVTIGNTSGSNTLGIAAPPTPPTTQSPKPRITPNPVIASKGATVDFTGAASTDDGSIALYAWEFTDGGTATGVTTSHTFPNVEALHWARLKVTDNTGKKATDVARVELRGAPPVANTGGPYTFGETFANAGVYTVPLDGSASSDADGPIAKYLWSAGNGLNEQFNAASADSRIWTPTGNFTIGIGTTGGEGVLNRVAGNWDQGFLTKKTYTRRHGQSFTGRVRVSNGSAGQHYVLWGLKDTSAGLQESAFIYAFYFYNGNLYIYEKGSNRATVFGYTQPLAYELRIDVKKQGATYYVRQQGAPNWTWVWDSNQYTDAQFRYGVTMWAGQAGFDNLVAPSDMADTAVANFAYQEEGTYTASLTVTDQVGQTTTANTQVNIVKGPPPVANPGGPYVLNESNAACNAWTVNFNGTGSTDDGAILSYEWNFGDGTTGTGASPSHTYAGPGVYNVTLKVTDNALQSHTAATTVTTTVQQPPVAKPGGPYVVGEAQASGGFYTLNVNGSGSTDDFGICSYAWDWGDGSSLGSGVAPSHQYAASGVTQVRNLNLTVRDNGNQPNTAGTTVTLNVSNPPVANHGGPYAVNESAAFQGEWTVPFNASASTDDFGIWKYEWTFGDSTSGTGVTPLKKYSNTGVYNVTLKVSDNANQSNTVNTTATVTANNPPVPNIVATAVANESFASGGGWLVPFDATGSTDDFGIWKYEWDFGDGTTGSGATISHEYQTTGTYAVKLTVTDHAKQAVSTTHMLQVINNNPPVANAGGPYSANEATASNGVWRPQLNGTGSSDDFGIFDYQWWIGPLELNQMFAGAAIDTNIWQIPATGVTQNERLALVGAGSWTDRFAVTKGTFTRTLGVEKVLQARILPQNTSGSQYVMIGWKNTNTDANYTQFVHAIYFNNGNINIYENGSDRGVQTTYTRNEWYDVRITLLETGGALYQYKRSDSPTWIDMAWKRFGDTTTAFKAGVTVNSGNIFVDDFRVGTILEGATVRQRMKTPGTYDVVLTVRDNALQSSMDATTLTVTKGSPPVANPGGPYTIEKGMLLSLTSTGSSDDYGIEHYKWDFGDGTISTQANPRHFWDTTGAKTVTLTVWDHVGQTHTASATVNVITGLAPLANAGGPYTASVDGVPAFLDGSASFDDYGIANYYWYIGTNTSGDPAYVGRHVAATFTTAGTQTVTLVVEDGAGQTHSATAQVNVAASATPKVVTVPWVGPDPVVPHETWPGQQITFKGRVYGNTATRYQWDFGDGIQSPITNITASNRHALDAKHAYDAGIPAGTPFIATLSVFGAGSAPLASATYNVIIKSQSLTTEVNVGIDEGLWYLYKQQDRSNNTNNGMWHVRDEVTTTANTLNAFMANSHQPEGNPMVDPYVDTVRMGLRYMIQQLTTTGIGVTSLGNPDTNGNGIGIQVNEGDPPYQGGPVMDALVATGTPLRKNRTPGSGSVQVQNTFKSLRYFDIVQEMVDWYGYCQQPGASNSSTGGWRYSCQGGNDNSAAQWAAIGLIPAERLWGAKIPSFIKPTNTQFIIGADQDQSTGQMGYVGTGGAWGTASTTASGMVQMAMDNIDIDDSRFIKGQGHMRSRFDITSGDDSALLNMYSEFALSKAMRLSFPVRTDLMCQACGPMQEFDWYADPTKGLANILLNRQAADGSWTQPGGLNGSGYWLQNLVSAWGVLILTRELFEVAPVADAGPDRVWGVDIALTFDGSGSFHPDPFRTIVKYEWDFNGDGVFDSSSSSPTAQFTYTSAQYPVATLPRTFQATLKVTDDAGRTGLDTATIIVAVPPHPPVAVSGGPYTCTAGIACQLNGSGSFDIDPTDFITSYEWELSGGGVPDFAEATGPSPLWTFPNVGTFNIGLRVWDNGVLNTNNAKLSDQQFTTAVVQQNLPPVANPGGPYVIDEGQQVTLDASGSSDPNSNALTYAWDLDNDGTFETPGIQVSRTYNQNGVYTVGLRVSDSLLTNTASVQVTVNDLAPTAAFSPPSGTEGGPVQFTDASTSPVDQIVARSWEFGGLGVSTAQNPTFVFPDNGTFAVKLTVTDSDGSTNSVTHNVTIANANPVVEAGPDLVGVEGGAAVSLVSAGFTDVGVNDAPFTASIDWGDGNVTAGVVGGTAAAGTVLASHTYADNGNYTITVKVTDKDGGMGTDATHAVISNANPVVNAGPDMGAGEGANVHISATFTDAGVNDAPFTASINWGDGTVTPGAVGGTSANGTVMGDHTFANNGTYTVTVTVTDKDGGSGSDTLQVVVNNNNPVVDAGPNQITSEGTPVNLSASFTGGAANAPFTATIDWGDGTSGPGTVGGTAANGTVTGSHVYADNGLYTVTVSVTDKDGGLGSDTAQVTVNNANPVVNAGPDRTISEDVPMTLAATFTDVGVNDGPFTATINWGDGSSSPGTVGGTASAGTVGGTHTYADPGTYTVTVTVTDKDGGSGSDTAQIVVESGFTPTQTIFNLAAEAKPSKVDLVWGKVTGAQFYRIYRKTSPTAAYQLLTDNFVCAAGASCVYADAGLTNGVTYYYVVKSVESGHESLNSNEVNATPKAATPVRR